MNKPWIHTARTALLAAALLIPTLEIPSYASAASIESASIYQLPEFPSVNLTGSSYMQLKEVLVLNKEGARRASFSFTVYNGDQKSLSIRDFFIHLESRSGKSLTPILLPESRSQTSIAPGSTSQFRYYAELPETIEVQDLIFKVMKWDFSLPGLERQMGQVSVSPGYSPAVPAGSVSLVQVAGAPVKMQALQVSDLEDNSDRLVQVKLAFQNAGSHNVKIPAYSYALQSEDGLTYPLAADKSESLSIDALEMKELTLTGKLPKAVSVQKSKLLITESFQGEKSVEIPVAEFELPQSNSVRIAEEQEAVELTVSDQSMRVALTRANVDIQYDKYAADLNLIWENHGYANVALPSYAYLLRTSDGAAYPLSASSAGNILPQSHLNLALSATGIPKSASLEDLRLEIYDSNVSTTEIAAPPLAMFKLKNVTPSAVTDAGVAGELQDSAGNPYQLQVNKVQRLPWEEQDIISIDATITNVGTDTIANPKINGDIQLDGIPVDAEQVRTADLGEVNSLAPGEKRSVVLLTKIPYYQQVNKISVVLKDSDSGDRLSFQSESDMWTVPSSGSEGLSIGEVGSQMMMKPAAVKVYEGSTMNLVYAEVNIQNMENRFITPGEWSGQFKTKDNVYFAAKLSSFTQKISPQGHARVGFWALIPKRYSNDHLELVVGEGITGTRLTKAGEVPDAFTKSASMVLPKAETAIKLKTAAALEVDSEPYHFSIYDMDLSYTYNQATGYKIDFIFRYDLEKNSSLEAVGGERKLVLKLIDFDPVAQKEFVMETASSANDEALALGTNLKKTVTITTVDWFFFSKNTLQVYERFEGYDRLLGSIDFH
ncbi:hypothetical protein [Paenibacillus sp. YN15]|uniref:hypothetical protein n=1 Tax=Paenibacillus sp. YN15 TaxID=1742774 RepID=UPI000DCB1378|nr:hypothetical protein [Paenibacillus sp. YN15]RAV05027.1 hypothetical protein DQG13_03865 [Paenibacillus sp. YN15]